MRARATVAVVLAIAVLACAISVLKGAHEGQRMGYQIFASRSAGLSWLVVMVLLAVCGVPLASFVLRDELYNWNKWKMRFERYDRDENPVRWWLYLWCYLVLFLVILTGLFLFRR